MMSESILNAFFLLPALLFLLASVLSKTSFDVFKLTLTSVYVSLFSSFAGIVWLMNFGPTESTFLEFAALGLSVRLDPLSVTMYLMISIIAFVVFRYSRSYLDGELRIKQFFGRLAFTLAFVQLLVLSGNLATLFIAWVGTSVGLHQLLLFYPDRKKAIHAARKKFIIARLGDLSLLMAFVLIYFEFNSGNLSYIFAQLQLLSTESVSYLLELAAVLIVLSACLKSVQVPFHGWLLDVMEAPTPVSALLHAGLLNAGPFLIIRFAFLMDIAGNASMILLTVGAVSALFGAIVATTQPAIKTTLAYSSIGHMGFTLMLCGFGVYSAALLHLIAHSFYKAHAFLSSGSVIEKVQTKNAVDYTRLGNVWRMALAFLTTVALYFSIAYLWGTNAEKEFQLIVISGIIFLGVLSIQINAFDSNISGRSILTLLIGSGLVINLFFIFESAIQYGIQSQIPDIRALSPSLIFISTVVLSLFFITVLVQFVTAKTNHSKLTKKFGIHVRNGLYFNLLFDRMMNSLNTKTVK